MPAKSKAQQRFMGMVYSAKKGNKPASPAVAEAAKDISKSDAKDFAETSHTGLPNKKAYYLGIKAAETNYSSLGGLKTPSYHMLKTRPAAPQAPKITSAPVNTTKTLKDWNNDVRQVTPSSQRKGLWAPTERDFAGKLKLKQPGPIYDWLYNPRGQGTKLDTLERAATQTAGMGAGDTISYAAPGVLSSAISGASSLVHPAAGFAADMATDALYNKLDDTAWMLDDYGKLMRIPKANVPDEMVNSGEAIAVNKGFNPIGDAYDYVGEKLIAPALQNVPGGMTIGELLNKLNVESDWDRRGLTV